MIARFLQVLRQKRRYASLVGWRGSAKLLKAGRRTTVKAGENVQITIKRLKLCAMQQTALQLNLRCGTTDLDVFNSVFFRRDYELPLCVQSQRLIGLYRDILASGACPLILDCGANVGFASVWFKAHFPEALVVSIEPSPENHALLLKNTGSLPGIISILGAVHSHSGMGRLVDRGTGEWGFQVVAADTEAAEGVVRVYSMKDLLGWIHTKFGKNQNLVPLICKIDIEGGERALFEYAVEWFDLFKLYAIEFHDTHFPGLLTSAPFLSLIVKHGFEVVPKHELVFAFQQFGRANSGLREI